MGKFQNNLLIEVEEVLGYFLNEKGMTNKQALKEIEKSHGSFWKEVAKDILDDFNRKDDWHNFHKTNRSIHNADWIRNYRS